jgi:hypothetical protein
MGLSMLALKIRPTPFSGVFAFAFGCGAAYTAESGAEVGLLIAFGTVPFRFWPIAAYAGTAAGACIFVSGHAKPSGWPVSIPCAVIATPALQHGLRFDDAASTGAAIITLIAGIICWFAMADESALWSDARVRAHYRRPPPASRDGSHLSLGDHDIVSDEDRRQSRHHLLGLGFDPRLAAAAIGTDELQGGPGGPDEQAERIPDPAAPETKAQADKAEEIIIDRGVEGGSWTLVGWRSALGGWHFRAVRDEGTLLDFMSAEDAADFEPYEETAWVLSFEAALVLFDEHPWPVFSPLQVHPEFGERIWAAVDKRLRNRSLFYPQCCMGEESALLHRDDWHRLCHGGGRVSAYSDWESSV